MQMGDGGEVLERDGKSAEVGVRAGQKRRRGKTTESLRLKENCSLTHISQRIFFLYSFSLCNFR